MELALLCGSKRGGTACFLLRQTQHTIAQESSRFRFAKPWRSSCSLCRTSECIFSTAAALHPAGWCSYYLLHSRRRRKKGAQQRNETLRALAFCPHQKSKIPFFAAGRTAAEKYVSFVSCVVAQELQLGRVEAFSHLPVRGDSRSRRRWRRSAAVVRGCNVRRRIRKVQAPPVEILQFLPKSTVQRQTSLQKFDESS